METLFTQYDESPIIYEHEPESEEELKREPKNPKTNVIISNLLKYGINVQTSEETFDYLTNRIVSEEPNIYTTQFDTDCHVDSRIWNHLVSKLYANKSNYVDVEFIDNVLYEAANSELYKSQNAFINDVIDKFGINYFKYRSDGVYVYNAVLDVPKLHYSIKKQKFIASFKKEELEAEYQSDAIERICSIRFQLLFERCRAYNFNDWIGIESHSHAMLVPVDSVSFSSKGIQLLIGNLARSKEGELCVQGSLVELKIRMANDCKISTGIYSYGQVVIIYGGIMQFDNIFTVQGLMHPPITMKNDLSHLNMFGGNHNQMDLVMFKDILNLPSLKRIRSNWVVISDLHLDNQLNIDSLENLFNKFVENCHREHLPRGFVLMGNFSSSGYTFESHRSWTEELEVNQAGSGADSYSSGFDNLFKLLTKPKFIMILTNCYIVFVPGPKDATLCRQRVPRNPLLGFAINRFQERMESSRPECKGRIVMASNPCRIRDWGRQLIFFRQDLLTQLLIDSMVTSSSTEDPNACFDLVDMLVETLVGQSHLSPNRPGLSTIIDHDASLLLHPLPDFLCLGDTTSPPFIRNHGFNKNCIIANCESNLTTFKNIICYDASSNQVKVVPL